MLTPPMISPEAISATVRDAYGLRVSQVTFLPLGADVNAAVYRIDTNDGAAYFLKLKRGGFDEAGVAIPAFLHGRGIQQVMAPLATSAHQLWVSGHGFAWILYPYFEGDNGYRVALSDAQWVALGQSLKRVHTTALPQELAQRVPREVYSSQWRDIVTEFDQQVGARVYDDPIAARLADFWVAQRREIRAMVARADELSRALRQQDSVVALCHADMHPGNILIGADDALTIVDWDNPIFAPKEHDLMCIGGGMDFIVEGAREDALFYDGYGPTEINHVALAYYRYERIIADVAAYGEQIFGLHGSAVDRDDGLQLLADQFLPGHVVAIAHQTYEQLL